MGRLHLEPAFRIILAVLLSADAAPAPRKIARFRGDDGQISYGLVDGETVRRLRGGFPAVLQGRFDADVSVSLKDVRLLPPVEPTKIVNFGWTYPAHAREVGGQPDRKEPLVFLKPPSCLIADGEAIVHPDLSNRVEYEGELALVIGKTARNIKTEEAMSFVLGYTCFNDVTARDLTQNDPEYTRGKGFDTFGPLGPWIVTDIDPRNLRIVTRVNGEIRQDATTAEMRFGIPFLIAYISRVMTLVPGDVLATGTPGGSGAVKPGDVVQVEIERIGTLTNPVR